MTITIASRPFLLLSPLRRRCLLPRSCRFFLPRCRWQQLFFFRRGWRRLVNSSSVAVGGHLPSSSMTRMFPSCLHSFCSSTIGRCPQSRWHSVPGPAPCDAAFPSTRPAPGTTANHLHRPVTHACRQPSQERHGSRRITIARQAQFLVERMITAASLCRRTYTRP